MEKLIPNSFQSTEEFVSGSLLLIDKPLGWTSFDALNRIKGFVRNNLKIPPNEQGHKQKFKIGHAGTLDPLATGLLVVCTGKFTKRIDEFQAGEKEYTGTFVLGETTPSFDLETEPEGDFATEHLTLDLLKETAQTFTGEQMQRPPIYSAKHVDGKRAYVAARAGEAIVIPTSLVTIHEFEITRFANNEADFRIRCSKGTYIRSIANDFGEKLTSGAYLKTLCRTAALPFYLKDALLLDDLLSQLTVMMKQSSVKS